MATKKVDKKPVEPADTEASVERRVVARNAQFITVDAGKLSKGLKTTFEGVALVFDSIGLPVQIGLTMNLEDDASDEHSASGESGAPAASAESTAPAVEKVAVKKKAKVDTKPEPVSEPTAVAETQEEAVSEKSAPAAEDVVESAPAAPEAKEAPPEEVASVSSITIDDITKIIVQKIRQNRNTNEKIAAILKTYGVAKVSELPVDKYEAFLTDLSAI